MTAPRAIAPAYATDRCHWVKDDHGNEILIPMCWNRVNDPNDDCLCGEWTEEVARQIIKGLRSTVYRERQRNQVLSDALRRAGISDPTIAQHMMTPKEYTARRRRREMHKEISDRGCPE